MTSRRPSPSPFRRLAPLPLLVALGAGVASAQAEPPSYELPLRYDSGPVENTGQAPAVVISRTVRVEGADWLQLSFRHVQLAGDPRAGTGAILRVTSFLDGAVQEMNAIHVGQWQMRTAYFNGDTVQVDVEAQPGTGVSRLVLDHATAGLAFTQKSQCGPTDDRVASNDPRAARALPVGCTAWLFDDCSKCMGTAGHCAGSSLQTMQFNVPLSNPNGSLNHPPPQHQYAVDVSSKQAVSGGIGNDWGYFGVFPNSSTGLTPAQAQGSVYHLTTPPSFNPSQNIRITGYGTDSGTANQTQQTHFGPWVLFSGSRLSYQADTTGGNSGSPVIHEPTGNVIGVHTHAGCDLPSGQGNNGTGANNGGWQSALANPKGVCVCVPGSVTIYCTAKMNSQGCVPVVSTTGTPSASAGAGSFVIASTLQINQVNGLLFYGKQAASTPFQGGFLCVGPPTLRTAVQNSGGSPTGSDCTGAFSFDMGAYIVSGFDPTLTAGEVVYAQYWGRDTGFAPPNNTSLTQGVEFTIGL